MYEIHLLCMHLNSCDRRSQKIKKA